MKRIADGWTCLPLRTETLLPATHTNAVFIGWEAFVVVDPGASDPSEQARLWAAIEARVHIGERFEGVVLTHHHPDHVSGLAAIYQRGVAEDWPPLRLYAHPETLARIIAPPTAEVVPVADGDRIVAAAMELDVLHTPGHAPGHIALFDGHALMAGDMVAGVGTIIVAPPEGDMIAYLASLERLRDLDAAVMVPSHGEAMRDDAVRQKLSDLIAHRLMRERLVADALSATPRVVMDLVPAAYPDIPPAIYPLAAHSLAAHLLKLEAEGRARRQGEGWASPPDRTP